MIHKTLIAIFLTAYLLGPSLSIPLEEQTPQPPQPLAPQPENPPEKIEPAVEPKQDTIDLHVDEDDLASHPRADLREEDNEPVPVASVAPSAAFAPQSPDQDGVPSDGKSDLDTANAAPSDGKSDLDTANTFWRGYGGWGGYYRPYYGGWGGGWGGGWRRGYGGYGGYGRGFGGGWGGYGGGWGWGGGRYWG